MGTNGPVTYVTDLEGQWSRFVGYVERDDLVTLDGDRLLLADGATFVFGGDAVDRGPSSRRLVRTFLDAKARYGERVILLAGNRDLNKLRLATELDGRPPANTPPEIRDDRAATLRHIFVRTMGAPEAFAHRAAELEAEGREASDDAVVASFLEDVAPDGDLSRYLAACQLGHRHGPTLFVHGGLGLGSYGHVPGQDAPAPDVDAFVDGLNRFLADRLARFRERVGVRDEVPPWSDLVAYQAPVPGLHENPRSVVYGRLSDPYNNPSLPDARVIDALRRDGVHRIVVGHSPSGDLPAFVRSDDFEVVVADNSRGRVETGASVRIDAERVRTRGATRLDDDRVLEVETTTQLGVATPIGRRTREERRLVKAVLDDGSMLTYRGLPGYRLEQLRLEGIADEALEPPIPPET